MDRKELIRSLDKMCDCITEVSSEMPFIIFDYYIRVEESKDKRPFYNLIAESYKTINAVCYLLRSDSYIQASYMLKSAIEEVAMTYVLSNNRTMLLEYIKLLGEKYKYSQMDDIDKKLYRDNRRITSKVDQFFDYGWIRDWANGKYGIAQIVEQAKLDELIPELKDLLNPPAYGSVETHPFTSEQEKENKEEYWINLISYTCKIFDFLCSTYKKFIGKEEFRKLPVYSLLIDFKDIYLKVFNYPDLYLNKWKL